MPALRHRLRAGRGSSGAFTHDTQRFNFSPKHKKCARARTHIWSSSKDGSSSCRCATTLTGTRNARKRYANNSQLVSQPMPKCALKGHGLFSDQEKKNILYGSPLLQATWEVQLRRSGHDVHLRRTRTSSTQACQGVHKSLATSGEGVEAEHKISVGRGKRPLPHLHTRQNRVPRHPSTLRQVREPSRRRAEGPPQAALRGGFKDLDSVNAKRVLELHLAPFARDQLSSSDLGLNSRSPQRCGWCCRGLHRGGPCTNVLTINDLTHRQCAASESGNVVHEQWGRTVHAFARQGATLSLATQLQGGSATRVPPARDSHYRVHALPSSLLKLNNVANHTVAKVCRPMFRCSSPW